MNIVAEAATIITVRFRSAPSVEVSSVTLADADPNVLAEEHPGVISVGTRGRSTTRASCSSPPTPVTPTNTARCSGRSSTFSSVTLVKFRE